MEDFSEPRRVGDALLANLFYVVTLALAKIVAEEQSPALGWKKKLGLPYCLKERLRTQLTVAPSFDARITPWSNKNKPPKVPVLTMC